mgnify:CR=1 FL=1
MLDPQARQFIQLMVDNGVPPVHTLTATEARQAYLQRRALSQPDAEPVAMVRDHTVTHNGLSVAVREYRPASSQSQATLPALLYFHGGGFTVGSPETHEALCKHLAHLAHCAVVSLDYRLAPEHTFPTAHNDAFDALQWLAVNATSLGLDATRIAIGGDSAGGTLTASTAIAARDAGIDLKLQLMFYPGCSPEYLASADTFEKGFLLEKASIEYFYGHYIPNLEDRENPRFSPMLADVSGVAPAWLGLAECDPIVDEGVAYADHLRLSGVPVDLEIYKGVVHSFIQMGRVIPEALTAHLDAARALRHAFGL